MLAAAFAFSFVAIGAAPSQNLPDKAHFSISVSGGVYPTITASTNLPDGTQLLVNVKKPWLPDAQQRMARGLAACGEDCLPATGYDNQIGIVVKIKGGAFAAGPFSFLGQPFRPGVYPVEISLSADRATATVEQIRAIGTVLFTAMIQVQ
jgi:hypothetical protein